MKIKKVLLIILLIIIILPFLGRLLWELPKGKNVNLLIVNKTTANNSENQVKAFNWVLNFHKYVKSINDCYNYKKDYYGFHPDAPLPELLIRTFGLSDISSLQSNHKLLYYIDNEGVSLNDRLPDGPDHYGGLNQNDYLLLKAFYEESKPVIAECNFFSVPTEDLVRFNTEQLVDIYYIGWRGKFIHNLNSKKVGAHLDKKWIDRYREYYGNKWEFEGSGIVLLNDKQKRIIILPSEKFMTEDYPAIRTEPKHSAFFNIPPSVAFTGWFSIVYQGRNEVISSLDLNLNDEGIDFLKRNGIDSVFPATIRGKNNFYYLAGNYSEENVLLTFSKYRVFSDVLRLVGKNMTGNPDQFFYTYYFPFMSSLLDIYSK